MVKLEVVLHTCRGLPIAMPGSPIVSHFRLFISVSDFPISALPILFGFLDLHGSRLLGSHGTRW
jgi:hypothetical protein